MFFNNSCICIPCKMEQPYWQRTQLMLQGSDPPLVRRPKLTPALLQKPPFRFLHDVISEVGAAAAVLLRMQLSMRSIQPHPDHLCDLNHSSCVAGAGQNWLCTRTVSR